MSVETSALVLAWIAILVLAFAMAGLLRRIELMREDLVVPGHRVGLPPGTDARGLLPIELDQHLPTLLLFADATCDSCETVLPELSRFAERVDGDAAVLIVSRPPGLRTDCSAVKTVVDDAPFDDFRITLVPAAAGIGRGGSLITTEPVGSVDRIRAFLASFERTAIKGEPQWR